ncbi:MAG: hypothetical protein FWE41_08460 [Coriobacteriia bacterium]|nr:hypothetical protein [Coriobacteriia bacterium]MCL2750834.1 hypothetical protein [Coriobacteriia bacterium]
MSCPHNISIECPCTYSCDKHGKCCACIAYHLPSGAFPACFFSPEGERLYNRSYEALKKDREK